MNDPNPYRGPDAVVAEVSAQDELAGRGARFGAAVLDWILQVVVTLPIMYFGGYFDVIRAAMQTGQQPGIGVGLLWGFVGLVIFTVLQAFPLNASGQTWGKKIVGIRIVDLRGGKPALSKTLGLRYLLVYALANIPVLGGIGYLVNVLMIFRNDRRCGHDLIAGTRVVHVD